MTSKIICSFCTKLKDQVDKLISGLEDNLFICNECIDDSYNVIHNDIIAQEDDPEIFVFTPSDVKEYLDQHIIGQDVAKRTLSVAIYNHFKRINNETDIKLHKSNVLMMGPSGTGKTLLVTTLADLFNIPMVISDATVFTEAGYEGEDVSFLIKSLLEKTDYDVEKSQQGIIFIDEIDKIRHRAPAGSSLTKDISGEGLQQALLKLTEGAVIHMENPLDPFTPIYFNTTNVLFIVAGTFAGIHKSEYNGIGIGSLVSLSGIAGPVKEIEQQDIIDYGFIPEFVGRFPIIVALDELTKNMVIRILTEPKNNIIAQFKELFRIDGVSLVFDDKYIDEVATQCLYKKTGARGLRSVIEKTLLSTQFDLPGLNKSGIFKVKVEQGGLTQYVRKNKKVKKVKRVKCNET